MTFEWDARKAATNLKKHRVAFEDAATVFLDPLAMTFPDPGHSSDERREITIGCTLEGHVVFVSHRELAGVSGSSVLDIQHAPNENNMKKESKTKQGDSLRPEYDLSLLQRGVRGKYYRQATAGTNIVLIEPELAKIFPDSGAVNRALRVLADAAQAASRSKGRRARAS